MSRPGALEAALNYYRAAARYPRPALDWRLGPVEAPTLLVWGEGDHVLGPSFTRGLDRWVKDLHIELVPGAGHWVHQEEPEHVTTLLEEFLRS